MSEKFPTPAGPSKNESDLSREAREHAEIQQITLGDREDFLIISPQEEDSTRTDAWKSYLDKEKLSAAWLPPEGSPYRKFVKTKTLNSIAFVGDRIKPRHSDRDIKSETEIYNLINSGQLNQETAVILDSGGAHSVAMAARLVPYGFQPVIMFDAVPHARGVTSSQQALGAMLYFAEQMNKLKQEGKIKPDASPVFVLDAHRNDNIPYGQHKTRVVNTHVYDEHDFPTAADFQKFGIQSVVYLNEANQAGKIMPDFQSTDRLNKDLKPIVQKWIEAGIDISYTGISPSI